MKNDIRVQVRQVINGQPTTPIEVSVKQLAQEKLLRAILMASNLNSVVIKLKEVGDL